MFSKLIILIFHSIVQLALIVLILKQLYIVIQFISSSTFKNLLLKFKKTVVKYEITSIFLLKLTKLFSTFQLTKEYSSFCILMNIKFSNLSIFQKIFVLFKIIENVELKLDRIARSIIIINESFVNFFFYF